MGINEWSPQFIHPLTLTSQKIDLLMSWRDRKYKLWELLNLQSPSAEEEGRASDTYAFRREMEKDKDALYTLNDLRFTNRDLSNLGALAHGPFGSIDMVRCRLNNRIYVRKRVEKRVVTRNPGQCLPHHEKTILIAATITNSRWAPHLLCTFQTSMHLCYIMEFAEGGSLGDLLESNGHIPERDLMWWLPQMITAIHWCHSQGFCHRDIKPSNFVITSTYHLQLIDFASSARLLPADASGVQLVPKESCLVLCGTCDYISPEILAMQEAALVALDAEQEIFVPEGEGGYGREIDWWSLGATIYELVYGIAPFFAKDIAGTYDLIMNHERKLKFPSNPSVSYHCVSFISGLLCPAIKRLGRKSITEITSHKLFSNISWSSLDAKPLPEGLQHPEFEYDIPTQSIRDDELDCDEEDYSKGFAFSAFFNSSVSASSDSTTPNAANLTFARATTPFVSPDPDAALLPPHLAQYVGFTWGPTIEAFDHGATSPRNHEAKIAPSTLRTPLPMAKRARFSQTPGPSSLPDTQNKFVTPIRPSSSAVPPSTVRRTVGGTARKVGSTRTMSDVEAMKQLGDCIRASARKRMNQYAGRTPGPRFALGPAGATENDTAKRSWARIKLDFERMGDQVKGDTFAGTPGGMRIFVKDATLGPGLENNSIFKRQPVAADSLDESMGGDSTGAVLFGAVKGGMSRGPDVLDGLAMPSTDEEPPPSPSPSPRPMSAMSHPSSSLSRARSEISRRGLTPALSSFHPASISVSSNLADPSVVQRPTSFYQNRRDSSLPSNQPSLKAPSIFRQLSLSAPDASSSVRKPQPIFHLRDNPPDIVEDNDATPRAPTKRHPSSAPPIFTLPAPKSTNAKEPKEGISDTRRRPIFVRDPAKPEESSRIGLGIQERIANVSVPPTTAGTEQPFPGIDRMSDKYDELEARIRRFMEDLGQVQAELSSVKTKMATHSQ